METYLKLYSPREIVELFHSGKRIFGSPMPIPHPKSKLSPPDDAMRGLVAENAVAGVLNLLTLERDDVYVFHSVEENDTPIGETDHLLLCKRILLVIETKNRSNIEKLSFNAKGDLIARRNDKKVMKINSNNLVKKVERYQALYPALHVQGIVVAHHGVQSLGSDIPECEVITFPSLIECLLERIDSISKTSIDVLPAIKDIAVRCIRNEKIN